MEIKPQVQEKCIEEDNEFQFIHYYAHALDDLRQWNIMHKQPANMSLNITTHDNFTTYAFVFT